MKKLLLTTALIALSIPAWAKAPTSTTTINNTTINPTAIVVADKNEFGAMADAPKLVRIYGDWYLGAEGGKALDYTNMSKGWFAFGKLTYTGTLFTLFGNKKESDD